MKENYKRMSLVVTERMYEDINALAKDLEVPMSKVITSILLGYFKAKRKWERAETTD